MTPELKPCPFCGVDPVYGTTDLMSGGVQYDFVACPNCPDIGFHRIGFWAPEDERDEVPNPQESWNRRTPDLTEALARLKALEETMAHPDRIHWAQTLPSKWADEIAAIRKALGATEDSEPSR